MSEAVLEIRGVSAGYGASNVIRDVSMAVAAGETVGLVGRNGAGKSTVLRAIMSLLSHRSGEVRLYGERIDRLEPWQLARRGIGFVHEERRVFQRLTVLENLRVAQAAQPYGASFDPARIFTLFPELGEAQHQLGGRLAGGVQQMLAIGRALMASPTVLLLDEPAEGLAPLVIRRLAEALRQLRGAGQAVLLAEQNVRFVRRMADRLYVIVNGTIVGEASTAEFFDDHPLVKTHLRLRNERT